ncbi:MAG: hypothetical protein REI96_01785 [Flavobacterium nitrogenifigens]|uniref:Lipoprotein n=1 Tax=Flavobacterium nitrogenifigens TaxID=1617283 RepID=A0A521CWL3_9FLAO|nr:hypothetical protein [Flavobacterium nitrogenifigens]KAF2332147.1 hypothetical protein DM397_11490 [Flavobacterium nitrogenifigens]MDQ8011151.1 hypothetical protein [Flavobacterium nitrogenifigens]SMO63824.1 hypothetical protein SAMN06265220_102742 [Flavobacterium nitrogenifigens]
MNKLKYFSILLFALVTIIGCKKKNTFENNRFFDKTFNWEIAIPDDYEKVIQKEEGEVKGDTALVKRENSIVAFKRDEANYFSANYENYPAGDVRGADLKMRLKDFLFLRDIGKVYPKGKMGDYSVSSENISGLQFRKAKIEVAEDGKTVATVVIFSRGFADKIFIASIVYEDENYGKDMIDLFKKSTFKK